MRSYRRQAVAVVKDDPAGRGALVDGGEVMVGSGLSSAANARCECAKSQHAICARTYTHDGRLFESIIFVSKVIWHVRVQLANFGFILLIKTYIVSFLLILFYVRISVCNLFFKFCSSTELRNVAKTQDQDRQACGANRKISLNGNSITHCDKN